MPNTPLVKTVNPRYFRRLLLVNGQKISQTVGSLEKIQGFTNYNFIVDINRIFSTHPAYHPIDRTGTVNHPIKWSRSRPWKVPDQTLSLDQAMAARVKSLCQLNKKINIFWSGGIDSTAIVTAFLKHCALKSQLRILYSPWSCYEHPEYLAFLTDFPEIELIDQSGTRYLDLALDGIFISGNSGDEMHASIDESFLEAYGYQSLLQDWRDFFARSNSDSAFLDFCERYFALSGFNISTVMEARWWFYAVCKVSSILRDQTVPFLLTNQKTPTSTDDLYGFYDCDEYENYVYWNIPQIMTDPAYRSWKQHLKNYCRDFDGFNEWADNKTKFHSQQLTVYTRRKSLINDQRHVLILDDDRKVSLPTLPFFSKQSWRLCHGDSLDYIFNEPDQM